MALSAPGLRMIKLGVLEGDGDSVLLGEELPVPTVGEQDPGFVNRDDVPGGAVAPTISALPENDSGDADSGVDGDPSGSCCCGL